MNIPVKMMGRSGHGVNVFLLQSVYGQKMNHMGETLPVKILYSRDIRGKVVVVDDH